MKRFLLYLVALIVPFVVVSQQTERPQYVVFQVTPKTAVVVVGGKNVATDSDGIAIFTLEKGTYNYAVLAKEYNHETGTIGVYDTKVVKTVKLRPTFGWLSVPDLDVLRGADVYVDGTHLGKAPIKNWKLSGGTYRVRIVKELYKPFENDVVIRGGEIFNCAPTLVADYSYVTLNAGRDCSIYVGGKLVGKDSWSGKLATGTYVFEVRKEKHHSTSVTKTISATPATQTYYLPRPQPIVGTLNVMSSPAMADVYVDDKHVGQTPLMVDVIIGEHKIKVQKGSLVFEPQTATVVEGAVADVNFTLTERMKPVVEEVIEDDQPFLKVEKMPSFMGGDLTTFRNWVLARLHYPPIAQENGIQGRVLLSFVVERDGTLSNIQVLQTPDPSLSDEAIRVLKTSPKWTPGKQGDKIVRVKYTLLLEFRIQN